MIGVLAETGIGTSVPASGAAPGSGAPSPETVQQVQDLLKEVESLGARAHSLAEMTGAAKAAASRLDIFHDYMGVFVVSFLIALIATPVMRRLAIANGIVDRPTESRKVHRAPVAYLGGVAVFLIDVADGDVLDALLGHGVAHDAAAAALRAADADGAHDDAIAGGGLLVLLFLLGGDDFAAVPHWDAGGRHSSQ